MAANGRPRMRHPVRGPHGGGLYVSELQRGRLLDATFAVVSEEGFQGMAVRKVTERAGVSSKTFYDLFSDREDCFLAAFDHGVEELLARARPVYEGERDWAARIRAGLGVLLEVLESEPALRKLVFVEALGAGPRVLERRAEVLEQLAGVIDEGRTGMEAAGKLLGDPGRSALTAEGIVGGTFGLIHARLFQQRPGSLMELLNPLMAMIVRPYRGGAAATRELTSGRRGAGAGSGRSHGRPVGSSPSAGRVAGLIGRENVRPRLAEGQMAPSFGVLRPLGSIAPADFRLTVRTQMALAAVAELAGRGANPNNREVSERMGVADQSQVSRLMMRLEDQGLLENTRDARNGHGHTKGLAKAWRLTPDGQAVIDAHRPLEPARRASAKPAKSAAKRKGPLAKSAVPFRLTVRTHLVLTVIAQWSERELNPPSNREISRLAGVRDQGQISKLLVRLEGHGLIQNSGGATAGVPNAWQLTRRGEEVLSASRPAQRGDAGSMAAKRQQRNKTQKTSHRQQGSNR
jgi:AcrR family transcriptional regulator/DNA-binding MarR family transcriptional regulator